MIRRLMMSFLILATSAVFADNASQNLIAIFSKVTNFEGQFTQTVYDDNHAKLSVATGKFIIARPNKFRWENLTPTHQLSVSDGKQVWIYQPDLEQATVAPITKQIGQTPLAILSGSTDALTQNYVIQEPKPNQFMLTTKSNDGLFRKIALYLNGNMITKMELFDNLDQQTVIEFTQTTINHNLDNTVFQFTPPKDVDVIKG